MATPSRNGLEGTPIGLGGLSAAERSQPILDELEVALRLGGGGVGLRQRPEDAAA